MIRLNGEPYSLERDMAVIELLMQLRLQAARVAVEVNQSVVPKARYPVVRLRDGDSVEVINFVGGG